MNSSNSTQISRIFFNSTQTSRIFINSSNSTQTSRIFFKFCPGHRKAFVSSLRRGAAANNFKCHYFCNSHQSKFLFSIKLTSPLHLKGPHRSKPSRYFEGHEFRYLSPDSTSGCQGLSNEPSNTSESYRVKFYVFSTGGTKGNKKISWGPPCRKNIKFHSTTFRCV